MEPSTFFIDREIKFKKADLEVLKLEEDFDSPRYTVCNLSDVKYFVTICPNERRRKIRQKTWIYIFVDLGRAANVVVDVEVKIRNFSKKFNLTWKKFDGWGERICTTSEFFDTANNYFTNGELIVKIKGSFRIEFHRNKYPFSLQWKIKESDLKALEASPKNHLKTACFKVSADSDIKYFIAFFPNGSSENDQGKTRISLHLKLRANSKIEAVWEISVDSVKYSREINSIFESSEGFAPCLCSTEELFDPKNGYFVDGKLSLKVSGTLMVEKEKEPTILTLENGIVQKGYHRGKNFTFIIGEKTIKVHKHVLKSASPVFAGMFGSNLKEVQEKKMEIIDFEYEIVHAAMKLLYSTPLPQTFTYEQMIDLLQFADKYEIDLIKDAVQDYLIQRISPTNVCHLINATTTFINASKLLSKCKEYLVERVKQRYFVPDLDTLDNAVMKEIFLLVGTESV